MAGNAGEHGWPEFYRVVKCKDEIGVALSGEYAMRRATLTFHNPTDRNSAALTLFALVEARHSCENGGERGDFGCSVVRFDLVGGDPEG
jgi:hypothetical protein